MAIDYGREIRSARLDRGWSHHDLAEAAGVSVAVITALESGQTSSDIESVLAALHLVDVHMLLPEMIAHFGRTIGPVFAKISDERMPMVLAAILDIAGRAAAGIDPEPTVQQLNMVAGGATVNQRITTNRPRRRKH